MFPQFHRPSSRYYSPTRLLAIQQAYAARDAAMVRRDVTALMSNVSPRFIQTDIRHQDHGYADVRSRWQNNFSRADSMESATTVQSVVGEGDTRTANVQQTWTRYYTVARGHGYVTVQTRAVDTWRNQGGRWLLIRSEEKERHVNRSGRQLS